MFRRRDARSWGRLVAEFFYPRGGWRRASSYIVHRLRRLPDRPERIARGIFAGTIASFTPFFGFHFVTAALIGWVMRANIIAALIATFVGNPITFPFIAGSALAVGNWVMGTEVNMDVGQVISAVGRAFMQLWINFAHAITGRPTNWAPLVQFFHNVFLPYTIGGIVPGVLTGLVLYYTSLPIIRRYQARRDKKRGEQIVRVTAKRARALALAEAADYAALGGGDDKPRRPKRR